MGPNVTKWDKNVPSRAAPGSSPRAFLYLPMGAFPALAFSSLFIFCQFKECEVVGGAKDQRNWQRELESDKNAPLESQV